MPRVVSSEKRIPSYCLLQPSTPVKPNRSKIAPPEPGQLRWRGTVIAFAGSLVAGLICMGLLSTLVRQVNLMIPQAGTAKEQSILKAAHTAWQADPRINNSLAILYTLTKRDPSPAEFEQWLASNPDNSLPTWAHLLVTLREAKVGPDGVPDTQPQASTQSVVNLQAEANESILSMLQDLEYAPPVRIGLGSLHTKYLEAAAGRGMDVRRAEAAFWGERWSPGLAAYRPILRELSGRILAFGRREIRAGRPDYAVLAFRAGIRLWTQVVTDSPLPEIATLAAAQMQPLIDELGRLQSGPQAAQAAESLRNFQQAWADVPERDLAVLPCLFGPALVPAEHRQVLHSITAGAGLLLGGCVLALLCLVLVVIVLVTRSFGPTPLAWRWGRWSAVVAPGVVAAPAIVVAIVLASDAVPFLWLASGRSVAGIVLTPAVLILLWQAVTHTFLRVTGRYDRTMLPVWVVWGSFGVVIILAMALAFLVPLRREAWSPPLGIQLFRRMGSVAGLASVIVFLAGSIWAWIRRRRSGLPAGVLSRGGLAVASGAMFILLVAAAVGLGVNRVRDAKHEAAFARVAARPIAAQLGADWEQVYFAPARSLVEE